MNFYGIYRGFYEVEMGIYDIEVGFYKIEMGFYGIEVRVYEMVPSEERVLLLCRRRSIAMRRPSATAVYVEQQRVSGALRRECGRSAFRSV